ncbi:MAG: hypothetical protein DRP66_09690 [Planctomycetota bacterium]|nr:MAG: hypothetical protein DRP66_09690 [Planctomycetota bacterium]
MTRFEVEEIANHVVEVEQLLDEWALDAQEMELELAELQRMVGWLNKAMIQSCSNDEQGTLLSRLEQQICVCTESIRERLSVRW